VVRPIVTGPAWPLCVTSLICKGLPVIMVYNPTLWEYSGHSDTYKYPRTVPLRG
jgi:hypothetical protein